MNENTYRAQSVESDFEIELNNIHNLLYGYRNDLLRKIQFKLRGWRKEYRRSVKKSIFHPERTAEAIAVEFQEHMNHKIGCFIEEWADATLRSLPSQSQKPYGAETSNSTAAKKQVVERLKSEIVPGNIQSIDLTSQATKIFFTLYTLITWEWIGGYLGVTLGFRAYLRLLLWRLVYVFIVTLGILFFNIESLLNNPNQANLMFTPMTSISTENIISAFVLLQLLGTCVSFFLGYFVYRTGVQRKVCKNIMKAYKRYFTEYLQWAK